MIESIELTNWKTHSHTTMRFQRGVNVLIGVMGAGKSSVMDAISFALFGTFPTLKSKSVSTKELISTRPKVQDSAEVKLTFTIGGERYTVYRKLSKRESTFARLEKGGNYIQTQAERVNEEVSGLLKIDYDTFSRAIYAEQNRLDYFLELAKGDRKRQIDQMLGLDNFSRAEENSTSLINSIRNRVKDDEANLSQLDVKHYKAELEKLGVEREKLLEEQQMLSTASDESKKEVKQIESRLSMSKKEQERRNSLAKEMEVTKGRINTIKAEIEKLGELKDSSAMIEKRISEIKSEHERLEREVRELKSKESASLKKLAEIEAEMRSSETKVKELEKIKGALDASPLSKAERDLVKLQEDLEGHTKELAVSDSRISEAKKALSELEKHISKCPVCERDLGEELKERLVRDKKEMLAKTEDDIKTVRVRVSALRDEVKRAKEAHEKALTNSKSVEGYKELVEALPRIKEKAVAERKLHENTSASYEKSYSRLDPLSKELSGLAIKLDSARRLERYSKEVSQLQESEAAKSSELAKIKVDDKGIELLQSALIKASKSLSESESKSESNSRYLKSLDAQISERAKSVAKVVELEEKVERMRGMVSSMNRFKSALVETESSLRGRLVSSINALMQEVWLQVYPYGDYPAIRLNASNDDYLLEACTGTGPEGSANWVDINGIASGGEKSIACLAMRISMSMVIVPNLRWLILDEPTHNIDENGIGKLVQILGESLPRIVDQVFIITHDSALKNIGGARVYQLGRDKSKNEPTSLLEL
ncbi:MAG: SMC family ATPase [Candidatus Micrarchaeota archaeon]|nr:SMC family ATPase [Candidatus Micrarchaeota archaeon]